MNDPSRTMIDRVQDAIVQALRAYGRGEVMSIGDHDRLRGFHELNGDFDIRSAARAAIKAMREPTDEMVRAGADGSGEGSEACAEGAWSAMLDAALAEPTAPR